MVDVGDKSGDTGQIQVCSTGWATLQPYWYSSNEITGQTACVVAVHW